MKKPAITTTAGFFYYELVQQDYDVSTESHCVIRC